MKKILLTALLFMTLAPVTSLANGGDQRVVDGKYIINLARSPFTPHAGDKVSMLVSFVDIEKDKLVAEDLILKIRIAKRGGDEKRVFVYEQENLKVQGGVIQIPYVFAEAGMHEIFFDFVFASNPQVIYKAPDFLIDIQPAVQENNGRFAQTIFSILFLVLIVLAIIWLIKQIRK